MELFSKLGIDWRLLVAQIVNFLVLLFVLYKLLYKPVLKLLDSRSKKINESLTKAEEITKEFKAMEAKRDQVITAAKKEAEKIIAVAAVDANNKGQEIVAKSKEETAKIVADAKKQLAVEKEKIINDAKDAVSDLAVKISEKILSAKLTSGADLEIIKQAVSKINNK